MAEGDGRKHLAAVLVILLILHATRQARSVELQRRACQRGGGEFCSIGKKRSGFIGLIDTAKQLQEALETTAFRKEVIIFAETRISEAAQTLARLTGLGGYAHVLPVLELVADCQHLAHVLAPWQEERGPLSCAAYSSHDERGEGYPHKLAYFARGVSGSPSWWAKWLTVARSVALGYNVMAVDSDVVVLDDWYWRVKQGPLADYTMLSQAECDTCINGGFTYVQNAAPNGPVSWLLYEAMFRIVRWAEDPSVIANASSHIAQRGIIAVDDQALLTDTMLSCVAGRPVFWSLSVLYRQPGEEAAFGSLGLGGHQELRKNVLQVANHWEIKEFNVTGPLAAVVCDRGPAVECRNGGVDGSTATTRIQTAALRMPHSDGRWPLELGGYPFGTQLGRRALAYRQAFIDLGVQLPPDPEDPAARDAARATPPELFGLLNLQYEGRYLGSWAETSWWAAGRLGHWHIWPQPPLQPQGEQQQEQQEQPVPAPAQAMGHVFAGLYPGAFQKTVVLQLTGHYDWRVAARLAGSPFRVFLTQQQQQQQQQQPQDQQQQQLSLLLPEGRLAASHHPPDIRMVVAYAPDVIPSDLGKRRFLRASRGLAQVAAALGAVAAWPPAPCWAPWAQAKDAVPGGGQPPPPQLQEGAPRPPFPPRAHSIPWTYLDTAYTVQPFGDSLEDLHCEWVGFSDTGCLLANDPSFGPDAGDGGRALLAVEFHHLRHLLRPKTATATPGAGAGAGGGSAAVPPGSGSGGRPPPPPSRTRVRRRRRLQPTADTVLRLFNNDSRSEPLTPPDSLLYTVQYEDVVHQNIYAVLSALRRDTGVTVLWLDRMVGEVEGLHGEAAAVYDRWSSRCRALRYYTLPEGERGDW